MHLYILPQIILICDFKKVNLLMKFDPKSVYEKHNGQKSSTAVERNLKFVWVRRRIVGTGGAEGAIVGTIAPQIYLSM